ncbi:MAG: DNRLRE domain-containing protein [Deltaproteobacteria bacterium]|nr:DNRLRE domain-containing protein [Deltaproteobacteria bacterium]
MTVRQQCRRAQALAAGVVLLGWAQGCVRCAEDDVLQGGQCVHPCNADRDCAGDQHCEAGACAPGAPPGGTSSSSGGTASVGSASSDRARSSSAAPATSDVSPASSAASSSPSSSAAPGSSSAPRSSGASAAGATSVVDSGSSSAAPSSLASGSSSAPSSAGGTSSPSAGGAPSSSAGAPSSSGPLLGLAVVLEGAGVVADTQIYKGNPAYDTVPSKSLNNCGATGGFSVGIANWHDWTLMRALVRVDTSSIPRDAVVDRARLGLYVVSACHSSTVNSNCTQDPAPVSYALHRLLQPWGEGSQTACAPASSGESSWVDAVSPTAWGGPGASLDDTDRVGTPSATADIDPSLAGTWVYWDVTADVQAFLDGATANLGWVLQGTEGVSYGRTATAGFRAHDDAANPEQGPRLLVEYSR